MLDLSCDFYSLIRFQLTALELTWKYNVSSQENYGHMWKAIFEYAVSVRLKRFEFSTIHMFPPMKRTDASFKFCSIYEYDVVTNQTLETFAAMCMCFATSCDVR